MLITFHNRYNLLTKSENALKKQTECGERGRARWRTWGQSCHPAPEHSPHSPSSKPADMQMKAPKTGLFVRGYGYVSEFRIWNFEFGSFSPHYGGRQRAGEIMGKMNACALCRASFQGPQSFRAAQR